MAPPTESNANPGLSVWKPIFPEDELPKSFPKNLRRPGSERHQTDGYAPDIDSDDEDHEELDDESNEFTHERSSPQAEKCSPPPAAPRGKTSVKARVTGGRAAVPKQVVANMDSDDEIIKEMKGLGYRDEAVRDRLINEGRIKYEAKTISTRYIRIKRVLAAQEERILDEELSDWHDGDDENLLAAYEEAREQISADLAELVERQWKVVAENLKKKMPIPKFSRHACRERYNSLNDGTARIPPERDPDPEAREAERLAKVEERNRIKLAEMERERLAEETMQHALEEEARVIAEAKAKRVEKRKQAEADKDAAKEEIKARLAEKVTARKVLDERKAAAAHKAAEDKKAKLLAESAAKAAAKEARIAERQLARESRDERLAQEKVSRAEKARAEQEAKLEKLKSEHVARGILYRQMKQSLSSGVSADNSTSHLSADAPPKGTDGSAKPDMIRVSQPSGAPVRKVSPVQLAPIKLVKKRKHGPTSSVPKITDPSLIQGPEHKRVCTSSGSAFETTTTTAGDPRRSLTTDALRAILRTRALPTSGKKQQLIDRIADVDSGMDKKQLRNLCLKRKLKVSGNMAKLRYRIAEDDAKAVADQGQRSAPAQANSTSLLGEKVEKLD